MARPKELQDPQHVSVKIDKALLEVAKERAEKNGRTLSDVIRQGLMGWVLRTELEGDKKPEK